MPVVVNLTQGVWRGASGLVGEDHPDSRKGQVGQRQGALATEGENKTKGAAVLVGFKQRGRRQRRCHRKNARKKSRLTWDSVGAVSSSLSGAAPREAPGLFSPVPIPRRLAKFSSLLALRISTCCSSLRRRSSSGLKVLFALKLVRRCSGMYRSAMVVVEMDADSGSDCFWAARQEGGR